MKRIPLTNSNLSALVSDIDYKRVSAYTWYVVKPHNVTYAITTIKDGNKKKNIRMHRFILDCNENDIVDHINGNGIDNQRENLRVVSSSSNQANMRSRCVNKTSLFKGVSRKNGKWVAQIQVNKKKFHLGYYLTEQEAAISYNISARQFFGEYAHINDVKENLIPKKVKHDIAGTRNGAAKLSEENVREIRTSKLPSSELANLFNVTPSTINRIRSGFLWKGVPA